MSRLKDSIQDWLEICGFELGYDYSSLPDLSDFEIIKKEQIKYYKYAESEIMIN